MFDQAVLYEQIGDHAALVTVSADGGMPRAISIERISSDTEG